MFVLFCTLRKVSIMLIELLHKGRLFLIKVNGIIRTQNRAIHLADMTHIQLLLLFYYCLLIDTLRLLYYTIVMFRRWVQASFNRPFKNVSLRLDYRVKNYLLHPYLLFYWSVELIILIFHHVEKILLALLYQLLLYSDWGSFTRLDEVLELYKI